MSHTKSTQTAHRRESATASPSLMRDVGKGLLISIGGALLLNLTATLIAYFSPDPAALARPLGLAASALTALLGGWTTARMHHHAALLCGLANGCAMITLLFLLSLCFGALASGYSLIITLGLHLAYLALSVVGAFLGIRQKNTRTVKRRKKHAARSV